MIKESCGEQKEKTESRQPKKEEKVKMEIGDSLGGESGIRIMVGKWYG